MKKGLRRVATVAVAALVVAPALATAASATPTFAFDRLGGIDRYATSVAVATTYGASSNVILANGDNRAFPDALTAAYLAGEKNAPVMLTKLASTPANVLARIAASGATTVYLVGGTGVISAAQAAALDVTYNVVRLGGLDRYLTAQAVIADAGVATSTTAVLATGVNFPDAIAGGPLSYVKGMPLAITATNTLPAATLAALKTAGTTNVIVLGGPTIITQAVLDTLAANGITLNRRIFGANRSETSSLLAEYLATSQGFSTTGVNIASGYARGGGADALAGGPLSGKENRPTLITESVTNVGPGPIKYLTDHAATLATGHIFGGLGAVSQASEDAMEAAARGGVAAGPITLTSATVAQGGSLTGTLANPASVSNVAVAGCGINNANVAVSGTGAITLLVPASQAPGACSLVFTITNTNGTTSTQTIPVTVTGTARGVTAGPDLVSTAIVTGTNNVVYTFDSPLASAQPGLNPSYFHVYDANGNEFNPQQITSSGSIVTARYLATELALATTASVDHAAVLDASLRPNPTNALALKTVTLAIGVTDAPDLLSIGNPGIFLGNITFDFTFDAPIDTTPFPTAGGFSVVSTDGNVEFPGTLVPTISVDNRTVTVAFATLSAAAVPASGVVRGSVDSGTVADRDDAALINPLESAKVTAALATVTNAPDLLTVAVIGTDRVRYTFDQPVVGTAAPNFFIYDASGLAGSEADGDTFAPVSGNANAVDVFFGTTFPGAVANAVGASVEVGAVTATTGAPLLVNQKDELGLQSVTYQAGRTALPDLVSVTKSTSVFGVTAVAYTFDDPIPTTTGVIPVPVVLTSSQFFLYDATGARFTTAVVTPTFSTDRRVVTITSGFTAAQLTAAIIGAVDATPATADDLTPATPTFPEGQANAV